MIRRLGELARGNLRYWRWVIGNIRRNVDGHWPIFGSLLSFAFVSAAALYAVEAPRGSPIDSYWKAFFTTWITMTTVGYGNLVPVTFLGQIIVSVDAIVGLVLVGMIVWFVTGSLQGSSNPPDPPSGGSGDRMDE